MEKPSNYSNSIDVINYSDDYKGFFNIEAEKALLGSLIVQNDVFDEINDIIKPVYFYIEAHQEIYKIISKIVNNGNIAEALNIAAEASIDKKFKNYITTTYLTELCLERVNILGSKVYAKIIKNLYIKREISLILNKSYTHLSEHTESVDTMEYLEGEIFKISDIVSNYTSIMNFDKALELSLEVIDSARKNKGGVSGLATELIDLDKALGGLHKSDLIIIAARPGMGKTGLATNIATNIAYNSNNNSVLMFSLEMSSEQLATRVISQQARIEADKIRKGQINDQEYNQIINTLDHLKKINFFIDDSPNLTIGELRSKARKIKRTNNLQLIIVDYIQLMHSNQKFDNRVLEISAITRGLKSIAKELNIPVIALSQLSRQVETRDKEDKRPILADLRESGSIEQDADIVMFIYREAYYLSNAEPKQDGSDEQLKRLGEWHKKLAENKNKATILIAKNRHGPVKNVDLSFLGEYVTFSNYMSNNK